ncbi:hypothetical protein [Muricoccus radiodurans]|uniref:hypothetical protein n=1 Tax=Muricoccus radiodurans TaxID=2231721 RepID=UPI003CEA2CA9
MRDVDIPGLVVLAARDVLAAMDSLSISADILAARLSGVTPTLSTEPVQLSPDGTTLVILGGKPIYFRSAEQIAVIRKLIVARENGRRLRAADLATHGTLRRLFGTEKWERLKPFLSSQNG